MIDHLGRDSFTSLDHKISAYKNRIEFYCTTCQDKRIFAPDFGSYSASQVVNEMFPKHTIKNKPAMFKTFRCSANQDHRIVYGFLAESDELIKVAEYPSKYDMVADGFNKHKKYSIKKS